LGLTLDSRWSFWTHFNEMALRVAKAANNGPTAPQSGSEFAVRLYAEVHSIALYATSM